MCNTADLSGEKSFQDTAFTCSSHSCVCAAAGFAGTTPDPADGADPVPRGAIDTALIKYPVAELITAVRAGFQFSKGGFGPVFRSTLRGTTVAIKVLAADSEQGEEEFRHEVRVPEVGC